MKKALLAFILILLVAAYLSDIGRFLSLDYLKSEQESLQLLISNNFFETVLAFFAVYVVTTALSIPGAAILTIAAGALFGLTTGLIIVSFASTIGATCAFLISRFLLRDYVEGKFADKLKTINQGIAREGAFYLFSIRQIAVFPFFVVNLVFGLTKMKARTFFWVSQIGMLPGTIAYVNAGTQLSTISSVGDILSFNVLLSFAILGVLPLIMKKIVEIIRKKKIDGQIQEA